MRQVRIIIRNKHIILHSLSYNNGNIILILPMGKWIWITKKFAHIASKWQRLARLLGSLTSEPAPVTAMYYWLPVFLIWLWAPLRKGRTRPCFNHLHSNLPEEFLHTWHFLSICGLHRWKICMTTPSPSVWSTSAALEAASRGILPFLVYVVKGSTFQGRGHGSPFTTSHSLCAMPLPFFF